jgi:hypothetical protein
VAQRFSAAFHWVTLNVLAESMVLLDVPHPPIVEALLPNFAAKAQFFFGSKREATLDQL